jgi:hypothetical protein
MTEEQNSKPVQSLKGIIGQPENPVSVEDMAEACAGACMPKPLTVAELIDILGTLPASARVIVQGYESGFNDATGARFQPLVVGGGHREPDCLGPYVPAIHGGGGDHESPEEAGVAAGELAVLITSTRERETGEAGVNPASGVTVKPATPLEQLHGTVRRYDSPTDTVWPTNDEN